MRPENSHNIFDSPKKYAKRTYKSLLIRTPRPITEAEWNEIKARLGHALEASMKEVVAERDQ